MAEELMDAVETEAAAHVHKEALCYSCALRMSILFRYGAPPSMQQLLVDADHTHTDLPSDEPLVDDRHHPRFSIVHESRRSARRFTAAPLLPLQPPLESREAAAATNRRNTSNGMLAGEGAPRYHVTWLCVACQGLYQFLDLVHAPTVAVQVRSSPYADSRGISINVNVNRSFTFTWLAAATRYYDNKGTMTERPEPGAIVPEELSNFKEFYMSDLRARVLQYLLRSHADVVGSKGAHLLGFDTYTAAMEELMGSETSEPALKKQRLGVDEDAPQSSLTTSLQGFSYSLNNDSVVADVYCRHYPTEALITSNRLPQQYCSNRTSTVLNYGVLYDYVLPYLDEIGWAPSMGADTRHKQREAATLSSIVTHANIYLIGNYQKMVRNLSQSPWFNAGTRIGTFSLQEIIANPVLPFFFPEGVSAAVVSAPPIGRAVATPGNGGDSVPAATEAPSSLPQNVAPSAVAAELVFGYGRYKFHSAGREDVDVRMLGTGRPFVLELVSPSREHFSDADLRAMEEAINESEGGSVEVSDLRRTDVGITVRLARHSESKVKRYRCVVWSSRAIQDPANDPHFNAVNSVRNLPITQRTPLRVLHRRSLLARPRIIHSMKLTPVNEHWFLLDVETQAGTYVKEFVHGDLGRTTPNLGELLNARTDIIQLDVLGMDLLDLDAIAQGAAP